MDKKLLLLLLPAAMVLAGCGGEPASSSTSSTDGGELPPDTSSTDGGDNPGGDVGEPTPQEAWEAALQADYSNMTTYYMMSTSDYPVYTFYVDGYSIVRDDSFFAMYGYTEYMYYHDYNGESYLYFEDEGNGDAWLDKGYHDAPLGMHNTYLDYPYMIDVMKNVPWSTINYGAEGNPIYYVTDPDAVSELTASFLGFLGFDFFEPAYFGFSVLGGYVDSIVIFDDYGDNANSVSCSILTDTIGTTVVPSDAVLPPEPSESNVRTYADYKGEDPWVEVPVTSIELAPVDPDQSLTITVGSSFEADYKLLPEGANVAIPSCSSSDEAVALIGFNDNGTLTVYANGIGTADVYVTDLDTGIESNKLTITVVGDVPTITLEPVAELTFSEVNDDLSVTCANSVENGLDVKAFTGDAENLVVDYPTGGDSPLAEDVFTRIVTWKPGQNVGHVESTLGFDAGEGHSFKALAFEWGLLFESHEANLDWVEARIEVSDDGEAWTLDTDWTAEFKSKASGNHTRLFEHELSAEHRYVRIVFDSGFIGKPCWVATQGVTLY